MTRPHTSALGLVAAVALFAPAAYADLAGCVGHVGTERGVGVLFLAIGLAAFGWSRRRGG